MVSGNLEASGGILCGLLNDPRSTLLHFGRAIAIAGVPCDLLNDPRSTQSKAEGRPSSPLPARSRAARGFEANLADNLGWLSLHNRQVHQDEREMRSLAADESRFGLK